ncbi:MAG: M50 family metallopeptidase [Candidatus Buchananbacteria bacterium]
MILTIITFLIILSILVLVHEFGHFSLARLFGVKVDEFGLGLPPRAIGWQKRVLPLTGLQKVDNTITTNENPHTIFSLNWLPLGGFVKIKGEQGEAANDTDSFASKPLWQRGIILAAGVTLNFLFTIFLFSIGYLIGLPQVIENDLPGAIITNNKIQITEVLKDSPAQQANLAVGDIILAINNSHPQTVTEVQQLIATQSGQKVTLEIKRGEALITSEVTPNYLPELTKVGLGVSLMRSGTVSYQPFLALWHGLLTTIDLLMQIISGLFNLLFNLLTWQKVGVDIVGPVGIAVLTGSMVKLGWVYVLQFTAILSLTLAVMNFLPLPALDGGRFLFLVIAKIRGKSVDQKLENFIHNLGFILLLGLILIVTCKDLYHLQDKFIGLWHSLTNFF